MKGISGLRKHVMAFALAGGAVMFLAGFGYGYADSCNEAGWYLPFVD